MQTAKTRQTGIDALREAGANKIDTRFNLGHCGCELPANIISGYNEEEYIGLILICDKCGIFDPKQVTII